MQSLLKVGALCCVVLMVSGLPAHSDNDLLNGIYKDCLDKESMSCIKYKIFNFVDNFAQRDTFALTEGVQIVKTGDAPAVGARSINGDESIESLVWGRLQSFLATHTIKVDLKGSDVVNAVASTGRALEDVSENLLGGEESSQGESRGKKKKAAKILGPLLLAVALKAAALLPLLLGAIALIAGKALLVGKLALVLSAVIGLKKLLSHEKHVTYEVVAHPHHSSSHSSSHGEAFAASGFSGDVASYGGASSSTGGAHGGWGRSSDAQELAYSAQKQ